MLRDDGFFWRVNRVAGELQRWIDKVHFPAQTDPDFCGNVVAVAFTQYTVSISIGDMCLWDDQGSSHDDLNFKKLKAQFQDLIAGYRPLMKEEDSE